MRIPTRKPGKYADLFRDPHMTQEKFDELSALLARLKKARPEAAAEVKRLAEMGDFSENAAYQLAKGRLRGLNQKLMETEDHLKHAKIISTAKGNGVVQLGSTVTVNQAGKQQTYRILGPTETNPSKGIISHVSPLGAALQGKKVGDTVQMNIGSDTVRITIISVA
ncbi:MAG: GreA/GreB family elongation factor [Patescibacteria group bacterium]|jgi:transcription elongation GreA/GreB family factor